LKEAGEDQESQEELAKQIVDLADSRIEATWVGNLLRKERFQADLQENFTITRKKK